MMTAASATTRVSQHAISPHLDSDSADDRNRASNTAPAPLHAPPTSIDFITGDINNDADNFHSDLTTAGFTDILEALGLAPDMSPWSESNHAHRQWGVKDLQTVGSAISVAGTVIG